MLNNSGSSSNDVDRNKIPNGVKRLLSGSSDPYSSTSSVIVRNLKMTNGFPHNPGRSCLKKTGFPIVKRISIIIMTINGESTKKAEIANVMSKILFII